MDGLKTKMDELEKAANDMAQSMYQSEQAQGAPEGAAGADANANAGKNGDDVVDADFKEKK